MDQEATATDVVLQCIKGFSSQDLGKLQNCFRPDYVRHVTPGVPGVRSFAEHLRELQSRHDKLSSAKFEMQEIFGDDKTVLARFILTAVQTGDFLGMPPSGRAFARPQICFFHFDGKQISENHSFVDMQHMLDCLKGHPGEHDHWPALAARALSTDEQVEKQKKMVIALLQQAMSDDPGAGAEVAFDRAFQAYGLTKSGEGLSAVAYVDYLAGRKAQFRHCSLSIDEVFGHAQGVAVRYTLEGEHINAVKAGLNGSLSDHGVVVFHFADGKIADAYAIADDYGVAKQLEVRSV